MNRRVNPSSGDWRLEHKLKMVGVSSRSGWEIIHSHRDPAKELSFSLHLQETARGDQAGTIARGCGPLNATILDLHEIGMS